MTFPCQQIRMETSENFQRLRPEDIWSKGVTITRALPNLSDVSFCCNCTKMDTQEKLSCSSCGAQFHLYCVDETIVPVSAADQEQWRCDRCSCIYEEDEAGLATASWTDTVSFESWPDIPSCPETKPRPISPAPAADTTGQYVPSPETKSDKEMHHLVGHAHGDLFQTILEHDRNTRNGLLVNHQQQNGSENDGLPQTVSTSLEPTTSEALGCAEKQINDLTCENDSNSKSLPLSHKVETSTSYQTKPGTENNENEHLVEEQMGDNEENATRSNNVRRKHPYPWWLTSKYRGRRTHKRWTIIKANIRRHRQKQALVQTEAQEQKSQVPQLETKDYPHFYVAPITYQIMDQADAAQLVYNNLSANSVEALILNQVPLVEYEENWSSTSIGKAFDSVPDVLRDSISEEMEHLGYPPTPPRLPRHLVNSLLTSSAKNHRKKTTMKRKQREGPHPKLPEDMTEDEWSGWRKIMPIRRGRPRMYPRPDDLQWIEQKKKELSLKATVQT